MKNKKWTISIMMILIITLIWVISLLIIQKKQSLDLVFEKLKLNSQISQDLSFNLKSLKNYISYSSWSKNLKDMIFCPNEVRYMSGSDTLWTWNTIRFFSGSNYICSWSINSWSLNLDLKIYFSNNGENFTWWILWSSWFSLTYNNTWWYYSWSIDSKSVEFDYNLSNPKLYDDNLWRKEFVWKVYDIYKSIFYVDDKIREIIDSNTNNTWSYTKNISQVQSGSLFLDISWTWSIKIIEFNKASTDKLTKSWIILDDTEISWTWYVYSSWLIQDKTQALSLDFSTRDIWVFLKTQTWSIDYKLKIYDASWSWVFIVPIKDDTWSLQYLNYTVNKINDNTYIKNFYFLK